MEIIKKHIAALSDIGKKRKNNEDAAYVAETAYGTLLAAADGMGGHRKGEVASKIVIDSFSIPFFSYRKVFNLRRSKKFFRRYLKNANREIYRMSLAGDEYKEMGTTAVSALIYDKGVYVISVGDSRCYTFSESTGLMQRTSDQTYVEMLFETGRIKKSEIATHPQKNLLLNAVGINPDVTNVEELILPKEECDVILLCTDGLYNMVSDQEIAEVLCDSDDAESKAKRLIDLALEHGGNDNVAVVLWVK